MTACFMHPILPCGFNSWEVNGDEWNGAGVNEPVWPELFDAFVPLKPLIITEEMLAAFNECPDLVVPCENDTIVIRGGGVEKARRWA